jgi:hypothetical protein
MLTNDQLRTLARASAWYAEFDGERSAHPYDERIRNLAREALGGPDDETIITSALAALQSDDRNLRVAALRVLRWHLGDERVADAVLRATHDGKRRVRRIAVQLCGLLVDRPGVADRLREMVDDHGETNKISATALGCLAGNAAVALPGSRLRSVSDLLASDAFRERVLLLLLQQRPDDATRELLRDVVRSGSKGEAVAATRVLSGMRMVNLAHVPPEDRKRVQETADPVDLSWISGRGYVNASLYWLPA